MNTTQNEDEIIEEHEETLVLKGHEKISFVVFGMPKQIVISPQSIEILPTTEHRAEYESQIKEIEDAKRKIIVHRNRRSHSQVKNKTPVKKKNAIK